MPVDLVSVDEPKIDLVNKCRRLQGVIRTFAGVDIDGLDLFAPMLDTLRRKSGELGLSPRLHQADMSDFNLPRRYALVMIPFNAVGHNMTQGAQMLPVAMQAAFVARRAAGL